MKRPRCRLVLVTPRQFVPEVFTESFQAALGAGDVASAIVALDSNEEDVWRTAALALINPTINSGTAFLLKDHMKLVTEINADGLHTDAGEKNMRQMVETLAPGRIVGAGGVTNRHEAMVAGETGVDYVMFGSWTSSDREELSFEDVKILTQWWAQLIEVPCIAPATSLQHVRELAEIGADFVAVRDFVWNHDLGPATAVAEINTVFDEIFNA